MPIVVIGVKTLSRCATNEQSCQYLLPGDKLGIAGAKFVHRIFAEGQEFGSMLFHRFRLWLISQAACNEGQRTSRESK